jgi:DNA-binding response OmpR family regulator
LGGGSAQAVVLFSKRHFDAVIAELQLRSSPDGFNILREFQKLQATTGKILITSTDPEAVETTVEALGAVCIPKPVTARRSSRRD